jgi:two-component system phosphate regulon sensor histidine kinase PhoR
MKRRIFITLLILTSVMAVVAIALTVLVFSVCYQANGTGTVDLLSVFPWILLVLLVILLATLLLAVILSNRIMKPINEIPKLIRQENEVSIYEEFQPLVETIHRQNMGLLNGAKVREDFTANVTHELKTPLTSISGYAELIENGMVADAENITRFAGEIRQNANRLLALINDIIRLSELDNAENGETLEPVNLYEVAKSCATMLQISAEKHHVTLRIEGEDSFVMSTRQMMEELLLNLCNNAIRYNNEAGMVEVSIFRQGGKVALIVKDNGIGIPKEHQERIFERFYRVDKGRSKSTGGTGLGLAIVKHILVRHDAGLELYSEEGRGTQVKITFKETQKP